MQKTPIQKVERLGNQSNLKKVFYLIRSIYDSLEPECLKSVGKVVYKKVATPVVEAKTSSSKYIRPRDFLINQRFVTAIQQSSSQDIKKQHHGVSRIGTKKNKKHLAQERRREKKRGEDVNVEHAFNPDQIVGLVMSKDRYCRSFCSEFPFDVRFELN